MKYFLGEIIITHKKTIFGWVEYTQQFSIVLVIAEDWLLAREKTSAWATQKMEPLKKEYRYKHFTTNPI